MSSRPSFWCSYCERVGTCYATPIRLPDGDGPSNRIAVPASGDADADPQSFYRSRRCSRCRQEWLTVEVPEHFLSGLLELRGRLLRFLKQSQKKAGDWKEHYQSDRVRELDAKELRELDELDRLLADLDTDLADDDAAAVAEESAAELT